MGELEERFKAIKELLQSFKKYNHNPTIEASTKEVNRLFYLLQCLINFLDGFIDWENIDVK
jgi:hypothetical protein